MRQLPLYLRLQQLLEGELPEEQYREINDLERVFGELDAVDKQKDDAPDEELDLDEVEGALVDSDAADGSDLTSLLDRKAALEEQLFGAGDSPWSEESAEIRPLRDLLQDLSGATGKGPRRLGRPRLERLLRAVENLDPDAIEGAGTGAAPPLLRRLRRKGPNIVSARRRKLLAEFRTAWTEALSQRPRPDAGPATADGRGASSGAPRPGAPPTEPES